MKKRVPIGTFLPGRNYRLTGDGQSIGVEGEVPAEVNVAALEKMERESLRRAGLLEHLGRAGRITFSFAPVILEARSRSRCPSMAGRCHTLAARGGSEAPSKDERRSEQEAP